MNRQRKNRLAIVIAIIIGVTIAAGLTFYALNQNMNLFYTATEIVNGKKDGSKPHIGQRLRIGGMVVPGSVKRDPKSLKVQFAVADIGPQVLVEYVGILPDLFQEGKGVVAQGELINTTTIKASEVLAKHDEKYVPPEVVDAMKNMPQNIKTQTMNAQEQKK